MTWRLLSWTRSKPRVPRCAWAIVHVKCIYSIYTFFFFNVLSVMCKSDALPRLTTAGFYVYSAADVTVKEVKKFHGIPEKKAWCTIASAHIIKSQNNLYVGRKLANFFVWISCQLDPIGSSFFLCVPNSAVESQPQEATGMFYLLEHLWWTSWCARTSTYHIFTQLEKPRLQKSPVCHIYNIGP